MTIRRKSSLASNSSTSNRIDSVDKKLEKEELENINNKNIYQPQSAEPVKIFLSNTQRSYNSQDEFVRILYNDIVDIFLKKSSEIVLSSEKIDENNEQVEFNFPNKNNYFGNICDNKIKGYGRYEWACGEKYEGEFGENKIEGKGRIEWKDGSWYDGEFRKSYRHGIGNLICRDKKRFYIGNWFMGRKHGQGFCRYDNDNNTEDYYEGDWKMDKKDGKGNRVYKNGTRYIGEWKNDKKNGRGTMIWSNGDLYRGEWKNGSMNGYGEYIWKVFFNKSLSWPMENIYMGEWLNGMRHGKGILKLNTVGGAKYSGNWYFDKKHGYGMIIGNSGGVTESDPLFLNDILVPLEEEEEEEIIAINSESKKLVKHKKPRATKVFEPFQFLPVSYFVKRLLNPTKHCDKQFSSAPIITSNKKCGICKSESQCSCILGNLSSENLVIVKSSNEKLSSFENDDSYEYCLNNEEEDAKSDRDKEKEEEEKYEKRWIKNCLTTHIPRLREIYKLYGELYCEKSLLNENNSNLSMGKIALWQLLRDCDIPKKGRTSLIQFQRYFGMNESSFMNEDDFNPFERVEFYQFISVLIEISWHLYTKLNDIETDLTRGKLAGGLHKLLVNDIFPNVGNFVGNFLTIGLNLLPIHSVYKLYQNVGEPHTAKEFLKASCVLNGFNDPKSSSVDVDNSTKNHDELLKHGINAIIFGERLSFIPSSKKSSDVTNYEDNFAHELFALRSLGASKIVDIMANICPGIKDYDDNNLIINIGYELTFLEFYEILLESTKEFIVQRNKNENIL